MRLKLLTVALALAATPFASHAEDLIDAYRQARANDPVLSQADSIRLATGEGVTQARATGSHTLFTTYTPGTVAVNAHFSWGPMYETDVMLDWLFAQER